MAPKGRHAGLEEKEKRRKTLKFRVREQAMKKRTAVSQPYA